MEWVQRAPARHLHVRTTTWGGSGRRCQLPLTTNTCRACLASHRRPGPWPLAWTGPATGVRIPVGCARAQQEGPELGSRRGNGNRTATLATSRTSAGSPWSGTCRNDDTGGSAWRGGRRRSAAGPGPHRFDMIVVPELTDLKMLPISFAAGARRIVRLSPALLRIPR